MNLKRIALSHIVASSQPRPLVTQEVDKLAQSIKQVGLIQPISVTPTTVIHNTAEPGWKIVAGHHRVAACRALGWTEIDALVIDGESDLQSELIEIDENLCRAELSNAQRTKYTNRRKQIWEALHPEPNRQRVAVLEAGQAGDQQVAQVAPPVAKHGHAQEKGFASATQAATGQSKATTNRAIARANALGDDTLDKVTGTSLDSGVELDALAKMDAPERAVLIERAAAGEKVSARAPIVPAKPSSAPARTLPMRIYKAALDMVHGLGFADVSAMVQAIADLPELTDAEQSTLDDALDLFLRIGSVETDVEHS